MLLIWLCRIAKQLHRTYIVTFMLYNRFSLNPYREIEKEKYFCKVSSLTNKTIFIIRQLAL